MAETNKNTANNAKGKKVTVKLPRLAGQNANQDEFYSVNGRNYMIQRGKEIEIAEEVAEVIRNAEQAEEYAMKYVDNLDRMKKEKEKELGIG